jgi:hypothetical protein
MSVPSIRELRVLTVERGLGRGRLALERVVDLDADVGARLKGRYDLLSHEAEYGLGASDEQLQAAEDLIAETMEFLAGAAARSVDYDAGLSKLGQAWLDTLSDQAVLPKVALVIPASDEFTGMASQVVRLRVPAEGIWALPVAVHEFGHFVGAELRNRENRDGLPDAKLQVEDLLTSSAREGELPRLYWHGHELFADAVAAATVGPAYSWLCVRYRFAPDKAREPKGRHPAPIRRMRTQLAVLDRLANDDGTGYLAAERDRIRSVWRAGLKAHGVSSVVAADPELDGLEDQLIELLFNDGHLSRIRYSGKDQLSAQLLALDGSSEASSVAQILNAAWLRRSTIEATKALSSQALTQRTDEVAEWAQDATTAVLG